MSFLGITPSKFNSKNLSIIKERKRIITYSKKNYLECIRKEFTITIKNGKIRTCKKSFNY
jgi:hypothetical protein